MAPDASSISLLHIELLFLNCMHVCVLLHSGCDSVSMRSYSDCRGQFTGFALHLKRLKARLLKNERVKMVAGG